MTDQVSHIDLSDETTAIALAAGIESMSRQKARWSAEEIAVLREYYPFGGLKACRVHLPKKADGAIYQKARGLGLRAPGFTKPNEQWTTTPFIDAAIKRYYAGTPRKGGVGKLALSLHRPTRWVSHRARQLGIVPPRFKEPQWSDAELELLRKHAPKAPMSIAQILRKHGFSRTSGSIKNKLTRLQVDRTDDGHYTGRGLAELFGIDVHVVSGWIRKGWLKAQTRGTTREHDVYRISQSAIRRFVIENAGAVDIKRVDKHWFIDLLAGE